MKEKIQKENIFDHGSHGFKNVSVEVETEAVSL
jgi:hypothetical protein